LVVVVKEPLVGQRCRNCGYFHEVKFDFSWRVSKARENDENFRPQPGKKGKVHGSWPNAKQSRIFMVKHWENRTLYVLLRQLDLVGFRGFEVDGNEQTATAGIFQVPKSYSTIPWDNSLTGVATEAFSSGLFELQGCFLCQVEVLASDCCYETLIWESLAITWNSNPITFRLKCGFFQPFSISRFGETSN